MEELDLKELLQIFWEKKLEIILITAIFIVIGVIYTLGFVTPKYEGTTKLLLATNSSSNETQGGESITTNDVTINSKLVSTYSELVKSNKIIRKVISNLKLDAEKEEVIRRNISVTDITDTEVIKITVKDEDPAVASKIANEIAKVFIEEVKVYYKLENVYIVDAAKVEEEPSNINHKKDVAIFAGIGIVISAAYVFLAYMLDTTVKSAEEIEAMYQLPVLAAIPIYEENLPKKNKKGGRR